MTILALIAAIALVVRLALFVALHVMRSDYNVVEHAVSDYAVGRTSKVATAMTWVTALSWAALGGAVLVGLGDWSEQRSAIAQLIMLAIIFVALPFTPTDVEGKARTRVGVIHYILAIAWFALSYNLSGDFTRLLADEPVGGVLNVLHWAALVSLIVLVIALLPALRRRLFGIAERVFIVVISAFFLIVAVQLVLS
ncbi:DUF998 domain-containing protein [Epidermidibacterium keratini]|uniref:DUF998 domain-containing protein n=1 Tax=Epidermidibacterium keratini TaxID=1891644 RepID=A0A7L4YK96_9ACTN|nr:DUF998 domain-containing protein [Epidermidibacterium keratini]QHB99674.1 DUF998 domain-containing protein [Epidermidibacterium keratini]